MTEKQLTLFEKLNLPFQYQSYKYDKFGDNCYISGQAVCERLNKTIGVGFWKYEGLYNTEKIAEEGNNLRIRIYVKFSFYNHELKEWIELIDCGSEQVKKGMNIGDATKSAITDGMKKCASRIGVASDLYNGLIIYNKQKNMVIVPPHYKDYYIKMGWIKEKKETQQQEQQQQEQQQSSKKKEPTIEQEMKLEYQRLYGSLDGYQKFIDFYFKKGFNQKQILEGIMLKIAEKEKKQEAEQGVYPLSSK